MNPRVVVGGLGPAGPELLTEATRQAIEGIPVRFLRTRRHPAASVVQDARSFDEIYESASSMDEVYRGIVDALVAAAAEHGEVLYLVPGSPAVAERSVELLRARDGVEVRSLPALSFLDLVWDRVGVDPLSAGVRVVDGHRFTVEGAGERGPLLVVQTDTRFVLSDIKLAVDQGPEVTVLQRLGLPDESVRQVAWADLDREVEPDHLTSVWIPRLAAPVGTELVRFWELVQLLRRQCPWDREQTHQSLTRHLLEETYETLEAIESGDPAHLEEELGDLLFQVFFHSALAAEEGEFTIADVARGIHDKLVLRHPHVFGEREAKTADQVMKSWEQIKKEEKGRESIMEGIPSALPSLLYAHKVQRKAASVGFDWPAVDDVYPKVAEELDELRAD
ncbi:MAG TPA: nucleoside triphosphate pyrophosphohydrolase, partial [Acidimicrobiales bacterium]|nr:nucleoside triphosphate pyrophosphohydrolase [Acidimicrobiales bacterium]